MTVALIPVKRLEESKSRLLSRLPDAMRQALTLAMLEDLVDALSRTRGISRTAITTPDPVVAERAAAAGAEILMHLEIYKAEPKAKGVVHCHPPHATAYAVTGRIPPTCVIPEQEVFVGRVALVPYRTPGTQDFADAIIPFVKDHNSILLQNHGIVCWADTVTHAEWYAEVLDTYCQTLMYAQQLGAPLTHIPGDKAAELLAIKKTLGLPDARHDMKECQLCDLPEPPGTIARPPFPPRAAGATAPTSDDVESIVQAVTDAVMGALDGPPRS